MPSGSRARRWWWTAATRRGRRMSDIRVTYTSAAGASELDQAFEDALAALRERVPVAPGHRPAGFAGDDGPVFERHDPVDTSRVATSAHEAPPALVDDAVASARRPLRDWASSG